MRKASFNRPKEKLRGVKRRIRKLEDWSKSFDGYFPIEYSNEPYWNWKIPVLDRLVNPYTTTKRIQSTCVNLMLQAASHINKQRLIIESDAIVTVLITYPDVFGSEICVFFDKEYFNAFYNRNSEWQMLSPISNFSLTNILNIENPTSFKFSAFSHKSKDEDENGNIIYFENQWLCFQSKPEI